MKNPWQTLHSKSQYSSPWIEVIEDQVIFPTGKSGTYTKVHFKNKAIGILPLDGEGNIYLVGQWRYPFGDYSWEIPAGGGPDYELPLQTAKRELQEETGILAEQWEMIQFMRLSNAITDEECYIFLARDLNFAEPSPDDTEVLEVKKIPFTEAYEWVSNGKITDSLTVAAILKVRLMLL